MMLRKRPQPKETPAKAKRAARPAEEESDASSDAADDVSSDDDRDEDYDTAPRQATPSRRPRASTTPKKRARAASDDELDIFGADDSDSDDDAAAAASPKKKQKKRAAAALRTPAKSPKKRGRAEKAKEGSGAAAEAEGAEDAEGADARKTPGRKRKATPSSSASKRRRAAAATAEGEGAGDEAAEPNYDSLSILERVNEGQDATLAREWVTKYEADQYGALCELVNFVVEASGCPERVSSKQIEDGDIDGVLKLLISDTFTAQEGSDYLVVSKKNKKFRKRFLAFWGKLVRACKGSVLYDETLMTTLVAWLSALGSSSVRAFRHTSTLALLQIARSVVETVGEISEQLEDMGRHQRSERRKSSDKKTDRFKRVTDQVEDLRERTSKLDDILVEINRNVIVQRYRDAFPDIRVEAITALADIVSAYPDNFLDENHVKYLGWTLSDKNSEVRSATIRGIAKILGDSDRRDKMTTFLERFKPRIVEIATRDKESDVSVEAVRLCSTLATEVHALEEPDLRALFGLVNDVNPVIRKAAGAFALAVSKPQAGDGMVDSAARLKNVVEFVLEHTHLPQMPCYAVDAMWDAEPALRDWSALIAMLTDSGPDRLSDREQTVVAGILNAACKRTAEAAGRAAGKDAERATEAHDAMTAEVARALPGLLKTYRDDAEKAEELCEAVQSLALGVYGSLRLESHMTELVECLVDVYERHSSVDVLQTVARSLRFLARSEHTQRAEAEAVAMKLAESLYRSLGGDEGNASFVGDVSVDAGDDAAAERAAGKLLCLRRLTVLDAQLCLPASIAFEGHATVAIRGRAVESAKVSDELCVVAVQAACQRLLWALAKALEDPPLLPTEDILDRRATLVGYLATLLEEESKAVSDAAFFALVELACAFSTRLSTTSLRNLSFTLMQSLIEQMVLYVQSAVSELPQKKPKAKDGNKQKAKEAADDKAKSDSDSEASSSEEDAKKKKKGRKKAQQKGGDADADADVEEADKPNENEDTETAEDEEKRGRCERLISALAKGACLGGLGVNEAAEVLAYVRRVSKSVNDVAKALLHKIRELEKGAKQDERSEWEVLVLALCKRFELAYKQGSDEDMTAFAEYARWLSTTFGPAPPPELRLSLFSMVQEGILWVFQSRETFEDRLPFLQHGLYHFVHRLTSAEAKSIGRLVADRRDNCVSEWSLDLMEESEEHQPFFQLVKHLEMLSKGEKGITPAKLSTAARKDGRVSRRQKIRKLDLGSADEAEKEPASEGDGEKEQPEPEKHAEPEADNAEV
eukprot:m51a1_g5728 Cohesin subunit SA-1 (1273) ;mRNA; f:1123297-1127494